MDYQKIHDCIIASAKLRKIDPNKHYDRHHIVPRSMGGSDEPENLVYLTDKEHFIIHTLLWKIYRNRSMTSALWIMSQNKRYHYKEMNSNRYSALKKEFRKNQTDQTIYKFENIKTGEIFENNRKNFREYADITYSECAEIIRKGFIYHLNDNFNTNGVNWKLSGIGIKERVPHNIDNTIYEFRNIFTGEEFIGNRIQFKEKFNIESYSIIKNQKKIKGWVLKSNLLKYKIDLSVYSIKDLENKIYTGTLFQLKEITKLPMCRIKSIIGGKTIRGWKVN